MAIGARVRAAGLVRRTQGKSLAASAIELFRAPRRIRTSSIHHVNSRIRRRIASEDDIATGHDLADCLLRWSLAAFLSVSLTVVHPLPLSMSHCSESSADSSGYCSHRRTSRTEQLLESRLSPANPQLLSPIWRNSDSDERNSSGQCEHERRQLLHFSQFGIINVAEGPAILSPLVEIVRALK